MPTLSLDGRTIVARPAQTLLECCREHGIVVPTLCHVDGLSEVASCRLCLVEVKGFARPLPACSTRVQERMVVVTSTERLRRHRASTVEMLLARGGHVCAFCPASGRCELLRLARDLGVDHHGVADGRPLLPVDASHARYAFDPERCVLCSRCVRACAEIEGAHALHLVGRGTRTRVATDGGAWGRSARCTGCGRCVAACPTGALVDKAPALDAAAIAGAARAPAPCELPPAAGVPARRVRLATAALGGCFGCHVSLLDLDERLLALASRFELVWSPLADAKEYPDPVDVCLVEGAVATAHDDAQVRRIRARTRVLVAMGDCAASGNVTAMRDRAGGAAAVLRRAWAPPRGAPEVPALLERVLPVNEVVPVDVFVPGCPPPPDALLRAVSPFLAPDRAGAACGAAARR